MYKSKLILTILAAISLAACSALGPQKVRHSRTTPLVNFLYPDGQIPPDTKHPILQLPLRVGLAYIPEMRNQNTLDLGMKQDMLNQIKDQFETLDYVSHIEIIPEVYLAGRDNLNQIKQLYSLDVMALVSYDQIVQRKENILAITYLTIVGNYIFPGSHFNASTLIDLAVIDLKTRRLLFRAAGTSHSKGQRPEAYTRHAYDQHQNQDFVTAMQTMTVELTSALIKFEQRLRHPQPDETIKVQAREGYSMAFEWPLLLLLSFIGLTLKGRR